MISVRVSVNVIRVIMMITIIIWIANNVIISALIVHPHQLVSLVKEPIETISVQVNVDVMRDISMMA
jgi:hypothetical protein